MLAQSLESLGRCVYLLTGFLIAAMVVLAVGVVIWVCLRIVIDRMRLRRAQSQYRRQVFRADGKRYPPAHVGQCQHCGQYWKRLYFVQDGPQLCPPCYEIYWRLAEKTRAADPEAQIDFSLDYAVEKRPELDPIRPR